MSTSILGGDVKTIFQVKAFEDFDAALEQARIDQEAMCGYPLVTKNTSSMDIEGGVEVKVTFGPPEPPKEQVA